MARNYGKFEWSRDATQRQCLLPLRSRYPNDEPRGFFCVWSTKAKAINRSVASHDPPMPQEAEMRPGGGERMVEADDESSEDEDHDLYSRYFICTTFLLTLKAILFWRKVFAGFSTIARWRISVFIATDASSFARSDDDEDEEEEEEEEEDGAPAARHRLEWDSDI